MLLANKLPASPCPGRGLWQGAVSLTASFLSVRAIAWPCQTRAPRDIFKARNQRKPGALPHPSYALMHEGRVNVPVSVSNSNGAGEPPLFIGVAGGTASGKTSLCAKIMKQLEAEMPVRFLQVYSFHLSLQFRLRRCQSIMLRKKC